MGGISDPNKGGSRSKGGGDSPFLVRSVCFFSVRVLLPPFSRNRRRCCQIRQLLTSHSHACIFPRGHSVIITDMRAHIYAYSCSTRNEESRQLTPQSYIRCVIFHRDLSTTPSRFSSSWKDILSKDASFLPIEPSHTSRTYFRDVA